jgi:hypothetical protein
MHALLGPANRPGVKLDQRWLGGEAYLSHMSKAFHGVLRQAQG